MFVQKNRKKIYMAVGIIFAITVAAGGLWYSHLKDERKESSELEMTQQVAETTTKATDTEDPESTSLPRETSTSGTVQDTNTELSKVDQETVDQTVETTTVDDRAYQDQAELLSALPWQKDKKLIDFEWSAPSARYLQAHIGSMQELQVFDGIVFFPGNQRINLLEPTKWSSDPEYIDWESLTRISWGKWDKNSFLLLWCGDDWINNYWDDEEWNIILYNMKNLAKAAYIGNCAGILLDTEPYSERNTWSYEDCNQGHTLEEARKQVRLRGQQVMNAWQKEYPEIDILGTFISLCETSEDDLLPYFINGMMDVLDQGTLIDSNEGSYHWRDAWQWFDNYSYFHEVGTATWGYLDPKNQTTYYTKMQMARALYWDSIMSVDATEEQKIQWLHNAYLGLATTDEYVWLYSEKMNIFKVPESSQPMGNQGSEPYDNEDTLEGLKKAKALLTNRQPLGFNMSTDGKGNLWQFEDLQVSIRMVTENPQEGREIRIEYDTKNQTPASISFYFNGLEMIPDYFDGREAVFRGFYSGTYQVMARVWNANYLGNTSNLLEIQIP